MGNKRKLTFKLEKDADGYPPDDYETLWVEEIGDGTFRVDNIPFYVRGISPDDLVTATESNQHLVFERLVKPSESSVIHIVFYDRSLEPAVRDFVLRAGGGVERSNLDNLIAIEVGPKCSYATIVEYLRRLLDDDKLDYDEASLRHNL